MKAIDPKTSQVVIRHGVGPLDGPYGWQRIPVVPSRILLRFDPKRGRPLVPKNHRRPR